jgi:hypothetical protein
LVRDALDLADQADLRIINTEPSALKASYLRADLSVDSDIVTCALG